MPPQIHPIFQKELDMFDGNFMNNGVNGVLREEFQDTRMLIIRKHFLEALQRASQAVVEESVGNYALVGNPDGSDNEQSIGWNEQRGYTISTARIITGV